jgi:hypothetical protein
MTSQRLHLHDLINGLVNLSGASTQEAAIRSGVSPGTVAALRAHEPTQVVTWCRMVAALGATLAVESQGRGWTVETPRPAPQLIEREWRAWRHRRFVSALHSVSDLRMRLKRNEREAKARQYVANEEGRLRERLGELRGAIRDLSGHHRAPSLRQTVRWLAEKLAITAEELALLGGVNLTAAQNALGEDSDGRLVTLHRLVSALGARLRLELAGGGAIDIAPCAPGPWKLGDREEDEHATERHTKARLERIANRSKLDAERILQLYDADMSIGEIARKAGISRQRVHKIAMDNGRTPRRVLAKERRINEGQDLLGSQSAGR